MNNFTDQDILNAAKNSEKHRPENEKLHFSIKDLTFNREEIEYIQKIILEAIEHKLEKPMINIDSYIEDSLSKKFDFIEDYDSYLNYLTHSIIDLLKIDNLSQEKKEHIEEVLRNNIVFDNTDILKLSLFENITIPLVITLDAEKVQKDFNYKKIPIDEKNDANDITAIRYILTQQGYEPNTHKETLHSKPINEFIKSLQEELDNVSSSSNHFSFLISLPYKDIKNIYEEEFFSDDKKFLVTIPQDTVCGLYDPWNGGGSLMNVIIPKDFTLPITYLKHLKQDGSLGYSLKEIYQTDFDYKETQLTKNQITIPPKSIENIKNIELFIKQFNEMFAQNLQNGTSILLHPREGINYSINSTTKKPFSGTNQLLLQQIRKDYNYKNPNFCKFTEKEALSIKPNSIAHFVNEYNSKKETHQQLLYINHQALNTSPHDIEHKNYNILNRKEFNPSLPLYNSISDYMHSLYTGDKYEPSQTLLKNIDLIIEKIQSGKISPIKQIEHIQSNIDERISKSMDKQNIHAINTIRQNQSRDR